MDPIVSASGLRPTARLSGLPTAAHEKAEENALAGPPQDRTAIGGLKIRKAGAPAATEQPAPPRTDPVVAEALNTLVDAGLRFTNDADQRLEQAFAGKREALLRVGAPYTMVASFASVGELQEYAGLRSGARTSDTFEGLKKLDEQGLSFYFSRDTGKLLGKLPMEGPKAWLRTDAAGAALLMGRGESIRLLGADGSEQKLSSPADIGRVQTRGSAEKAEVRNLLDFMEGGMGTAGCKVEADFPLADSMLASDYETQYWAQQKSLLTSHVERPQNSDFLARGKMLQDLASGGEVNLTVGGQTRPIPVNLQQVQYLQKFLTDAHPPEFDFNAGYHALTGAGGKVFARQIHGDARGQLVECKTPLAAYLNLAVGGECVVLDPSGDLKGYTDLHSFSMSALGQEANPAKERFLADYDALKKAGYVLFKPTNIDSQGNVGQWVTPGPAMTLAELTSGRPMLIQKPDGSDSQLLQNNQQLSQFLAKVGVQAGEAAQPAAPAERIDPATPKKNLVMVYYSALHNSEGPLGVYDDFAYKLTQIGSSEDRDVITLRSDQSFKEHLRLDYAQPGRFENVQTLRPETMLSEASVLENFVYESVKRHPGDEKLRLIVLGHGSAEFGVMDDFGPRSVDRIKVDDFAGAIKKALDRIEQETGKRPVIDNLILNSCLMGNSSMVQALAETGDVRAMSASPELMLDSFPSAAITDLKGAVDGKEYAKHLVDVYKDAIAFEGGKANRRNALVYGAYDCDPQKAATFKSSLKDFFAACVQRPDLATYVREDISDCKGYNIHPTGGPGPGFENRDLIQVAKRIQADARIKDQGIKQACARLIAAAQDQVLAQRTEKAYEGREGPSFFLPMDRSRYDPTREQPPTQLLKDTGFNDFIALIQAAAPRTQAHENALHNLYVAQGNAMVDMVMKLQGFSPAGQAMLEQQFVSKLEKPVEVSRVRQGLNTALRVVLGTLGGAVGLTLGVAVGAPSGVIRGAIGGLTGHSSEDGPGRPLPQPQGAQVPTQTSAGPEPQSALPAGPAVGTKPFAASLTDGTVLQVRSQNRLVADEAFLASLEGVGTSVNKAVSYRYGNVAGKLAGVPAGMVGGAVTGATVFGATGAIAGWQLGGKLADRIFPAVPR